MESIIAVLQELFKHASEIIVVFGLAFLSVVFKHVQTWWGERPLRCFERGINSNDLVRGLLSELRVLYDADRVSLWQMTNGAHFVSGEGVMRCIITHFVSKVGVTSPSPALPILTTHMLTTLKALQTNKSELFVHATVTDDEFQEAQFVGTGTFGVWAAAVRDPRKNWVGIVAVSWLEHPGTSVDDKHLLTYASQIGEFLTNQS